MIIGFTNDVLLGVLVLGLVVPMPHPCGDGEFVGGESIRLNQRGWNGYARLPIKLGHRGIGGLALIPMQRRGPFTLGLERKQKACNWHVVVGENVKAGLTCCGSGNKSIAKSLAPHNCLWLAKL